MAPKSKKQQPAEEAKVEEPAAKKAKADEPEKKKEEAPPKEPEVPAFQEPDAPADSRKAMNGSIIFDTADTTLNVVPTVGGKVLASLTDGGISYLLAGARANVAQKAGRYMFEAKIIQVTDPSHGQAKGLKSLLRIGFSTSESSLILDHASCVYFDSDGQSRACGKSLNNKGGRFGKDQVAAVVLNLDSKSENFNTVALYRDGVAVGKPVALPEDLKGKPLFPHITYRNATVNVNFGPTALKELPFKCRLLGGAAASDVAVSPSKAPADGKYEVVFPVAFPDEGTFEWLDDYLAKNPKYVELSDRKIVEWCRQSGLHPKLDRGHRSSNDKPYIQTGIHEVDNISHLRRVINAIAPVVPRNYCVMEVKSNLVAGERQEALKKFNYPCFKKVARVIMGEPNKDFKALVQNKLLKQKQAKSDSEHKQKKAEAARKKQQARMKKDADKRAKEAQKKKAADKKKKEEEAAEKKKKAEEEKKAKEEPKKEGEETKEEEKKEEPKEEPKDEPMAEKEEEDEKSEPEVEEEETEPPVVELTDEEKKVHFMPKTIPDVAQSVMMQAYTRFTTPDKEEGFDDIQYEWQKGEKAADYLKQWVLNKKMSTPLDTIRPGQYFKDKVAQFTKLTKESQDKLTAFQKAGKKKAKKAEGEDAEDVDIFSVADINDIGGGVPLFENFTYEDWELMKLRFEFCLLVLSFKKDANDPDREGIPLEHLGFYWGKYYNTKLNCKRFGMDSDKEVIGLIKDTVTTKDSILVAQLGDDLDDLAVFLKLTEEGRRERQRRIDAGDETARLKITPPPEPKPAAVAAPKAESKPAETKAAAAPAAAAAAAAKGGGKDAKADKGKGKGKDEGKTGGGWGGGGGKWGGGGKSGKDGKDGGKGWGKKGKW